jgi:GT2 family glycosyltransferase
MAERPIISLIIPTFQREELLRKCLHSIYVAEQHFLGFEVVVVDDGGGLSEEIEKEFAGAEIRWVRLPENRGQASAQEIGRQRARGEILAFLDDDCILKEAWLSEIQRFFATHLQLACVTGRVEAQETSHIQARTRQEIYNERLRRFAEEGFKAALQAKWKLPDCPDVLLSDHLSGGNFAIRREVLEAIGGFDQSAQFGNDRVMSHRLLEAGHAIAYDPDMVVYHRHDARFRTIYRIARRKMERHYASGQAIRLRECLPLFLDLLRAPFEIRRHPEMYRADPSRVKVYLAFTCVQALYALGGLLPFLSLYLRKILH